MQAKAAQPSTLPQDGFGPASATVRYPSRRRQRRNGSSFSTVSLSPVMAPTGSEREGDRRRSRRRHAQARLGSALVLGADIQDTLELAGEPSHGVRHLVRVVVPVVDADHAALFVTKHPLGEVL